MRTQAALWGMGVLLVGIGFGTGWLVRSETQGETPQDLAPVPRVERRSAPEPARASLPLLRPAEGAAERAALESRRAEALEPLRRSLEAIPPPRVESGSLVMEGTVTTKDGKPLPGVRVTAAPSGRPGPPPPAGRAPREEDEAVLVRDYLDGLRRRRLAKREATTDAAGRYRIEGLPDEVCSVMAKLDGWRISASGAWRARPPKGVDFTAEALCRLDLTVVLPDGRSPDRATISIQGARYSSRMEWTPQDPHLDVSPGAWEIAATAGDEQEYKSEKVSVFCAEGGPPESARLDLVARTGILGHVEYPPEEQISRGGGWGNVLAVRLADGQDPDPALLGSSRLRSGWQRRGSEAPTFRFDDLAPGRYLLGVARSYNTGIAATAVVKVSEGYADVTLEIPPLAREDYVEVRVTGPDGKPLPDVRISVSCRGPKGGMSGGGSVIDQGDGTKYVLWPQGVSRDAADTTWAVDVNAGVLGRKFVPFDPRRPTVDVQFEEPAKIDVSVTGADRGPYAGRFSVQLAPRSQDPNTPVFYGSARAVASGHASLEAQPGDYDLILLLGQSNQGYSPGRSLQIARKEVHVGSGGQHERLEVPTLYGVRIEGGQGRIYVYPADASGRRTSPFSGVAATSADGRAVVDGLPAGSYRASSGRKQATFEVPGATTVVLQEPESPR